MNISGLVFTGFNKRVAALERNSGNIVWQWKASKGYSYVSLLLDGGVLVVSVDGYMYGLNPLTGEELWYNKMEGFGSGVTSLVSLNGASSNPAILQAAAARAAAAAASSSSTTT